MQLNLLPKPLRGATKASLSPRKLLLFLLSFILKTPYGFDEAGDGTASTLGFLAAASLAFNSSISAFFPPVFFNGFDANWLCTTEIIWQCFQLEAVHFQNVKNQCKLKNKNQLHRERFPETLK